MHRQIIITIVFLMPLQVIAIEHPTALELLDKYAETRNNFRSFISKTENSIEYETKPHSNEIRFMRAYLKNFKREEFRFDGKRANLRTHFWGKIIPGRPTVPENNPYYKSRLRTEDVERWYGRADITNDPGRVTLKKRPEIAAEVSLARAYKGHEAIGYLFGDDERVDVVLRRALNISVRDKMDEIGGSQCYVIDALTRRGKYTIWIDPEHGYNIAKAKVIRKGGDIHDNKKTIADGDQYYTLLSNVQFKQIDGVWVPVEADIKYRWNLPTKKYDYWENIHHRVTEFIMNPDHDALGSFAWDDIQNGAKVIVAGVEGITYRWQNGKVVDADGRVIMDFRPKKEGSSMGAVTAAVEKIRFAWSVRSVLADSYRQ